MTAVDADRTTLLAKVDALEAEGRRREAIEMLTDANRRARDADLEQRLVWLRHHAFSELDRAAGRQTWPPRTEHERPADAIGPLEVPPDDLSVEAVRDGIYRYGSVLVPGAVSEDRVVMLTEGIRRAFDGYDAYTSGTPVSETRPWFDPFDPPESGTPKIRRQWNRKAGALQTPDSPRVLFDLMETFDELGFDRLIAEHFGEPPAISMNKSVLRKVPLDTVGSWHQDGAFLGTDLRALNVWITLTDCGVDAPGLDLVGRRLDEVVETGTDEAHFDTFTGSSVVERVAQGTVVRPRFDAGDLMLFDELMLHRSAVAPSMTRERYAIETWFFAPSRYPDDLVPLVY